MRSHIFAIKNIYHSAFLFHIVQLGRSYILLTLFGYFLMPAARPQSSKACSPWVKTVEQYYANGQRIPVGNIHRELRKACLSIDSIVKNNAAFSSISPARFRTSLVMMEGSMRSAQLNIKAYSKDGWDEKCGIIPQADRIAADDAGICFAINLTGLHYTTLEASPTSDGQLDAFREPVASGTIGGFPLFYVSKASHFLLITYNNELPWEPVTMAEYMDFIERGLVKKIETATLEKKIHPVVKMDDPSKSIYYLELRKKDPRSAAEWLDMTQKMRTTIEASSTEAERLIAEADMALKTDLADFRLLRSGYSRAQLAKQAIRGLGRFGLYSDNYPSVKDPLVKLKNDFLQNTSNPHLIKIISIWAAGTHLDWDDHIRKAMETLNYTAIKKLMH